MTTTPAMPDLPEPDIHHHMMTVWRDDVECEVDLGPRYTADQMRAYALATLQAQPAAVSDEEIDWIASQHTQSVEHPTRYVTDVRSTVRAILALRPQAVPMTQTQVVEAFCATPHQTQYVSVFNAGVRAAEAHHGITAQAQPQPRSDRIKTLRAELAELCEAEAKEAISGIPDDLRSKCIALVQARLEAEAIKHYRAAVGCTLVEAKHAVDAMVAKHAAQAKEAQS